MQARYSVSSDPAKVAFGGGSFAGVAALYAALHYPHVFGAVLVESPSLWVAEGRFLQVRAPCGIKEKFCVALEHGRGRPQLPGSVPLEGVVHVWDRVDL